MFKRAQFEELFSRLLEPRDKIQVISGPRQVGKSTLVKQVLQETTVPHLLVSADNVEETNNDVRYSQKQNCQLSTEE